MNSRGSDVIIIGAGVVGAATAYFCAKAGLRVTVIERGAPGGGTSSRCEGNVLVSDKEHGPELDLANYSLSLWKGELAEFGPLWEFEAKGGIIAASRESSMTSLRRVLGRQREHDIAVEELDVAQLRELEPFTTDEAVGAAFYPDDSQLMPMKTVDHLLRLARGYGARIEADTEVTGFLRSGRTAGSDSDRITGVRTSRGAFSADAVINCAGPSAAHIADLAGVSVPVAPRKGFVMVTEPMPPRVFHKVYAAEYIDNVGSSDGGLQTSPVVESSLTGSILIGSSRERVGFDESVNREALQRMARAATDLFPFLRDVRVLRHYHGFRPYSPDHVPVIGADPRAPGLWHACGHEGAGIGLSAGTGKLIAQALSASTPTAAGVTDLDLAAFAPERFDAAPREHTGPVTREPDAAVSVAAGPDSEEAS